MRHPTGKSHRGDSIGMGSGRDSTGGGTEALAAAVHQREMQPMVGQLTAKPRSSYWHATTDSPR